MNKDKTLLSGKSFEINFRRLDKDQALNEAEKERTRRREIQTQRLEDAKKEQSHRRLNEAQKLKEAKKEQEHRKKVKHTKVQGQAKVDKEQMKSFNKKKEIIEKANQKIENENLKLAQREAQNRLKKSKFEKKPTKYEKAKLKKELEREKKRISLETKAALKGLDLRYKEEMSKGLSRAEKKELKRKRKAELRRIRKQEKVRRIQKRSEELKARDVLKENIKEAQLKELENRKQQKIQEHKEKLEKKKRKGPGLLKLGLSNITYKHLQTTIKGYGYEYSLPKYLVVMVLVLAALSAVSFVYMIEFKYIIFLIILAVILVPVMTVAQFRYIANNDDFEQICNYIDQMILSFKQNPKILAAMESCLEMVDGKMEKDLKEAIRIIKTDSKSEQVYMEAFKVIEKDFRCSRIKTLHRFMLTVETENSLSYQEAIDNLYFDCRSWVTRTYKYQSELAGTKSKILIILAASVGIGVFFARVLKSAQDSMQDTSMEQMQNMDLIGNPVYQIGTIVFLGIFMLIYAILNTKVNGFWLINDLDTKNDRLILSSMNFVENFDTKETAKKGIILFLIFLVLTLTVYFIVMKNILVLIIGLALSAFIGAKKFLSKKSKKKLVEKELLKEFPVWMRDLAINLNNMVVVRAIDESIETSSPVLKPFLKKFISETEKDPVSIKPYNEFFGLFKVSELSTAVKTLYSIKTLSAEDSQRQVNDLIVRNQTLLESSEKMRNEDSVAGVSFISMIPMVLLSLKLLCDMGVMMFSFMGLMSAV